jgi:hypothetical protein
MENNKVRICVKGYQEHTDRSWQVIDTYTTGTGYVNSPLELPFVGDHDWSSSAGHRNHDLGNLISTKFTYSGNFTQAEKETIEWAWEQHRQADVLVCDMEYSDLDWEISYPKLTITAPFVIDKVKHQIDLTYPEIRV